MARRSSRTNEEENALAVVLTVAGFGAYSWFSDLSVAWRLAAIVLIASGALVGAWLLVTRLARRRRQTRQLADVLALTPTAFEERVQLLLRDLGYQQVQRRGGSGDRGVDLEGVCDGKHVIVQCKRYKGTVSPAMIRDLVGTLHIQRADRALLVTTGRFTKQGYAEASNQPLDLWDGPTLVQQIEQAEARLHHPQQRARTRNRLRMGGLALLALNGLLVGWALLSPVPPETTISAASTPTPVAATPGQAAVAPVPSTPTGMPSATAAPPTPTSIPLQATVFNGGNLRSAPTLDSTVHDQVHANETVTLLGRSPDSEWYHVINPRHQAGWLHQSLLRIDAAVYASVPVEAGP